MGAGREFDWSKTPLGPVAEWPQSLRSAVSILLPSKAKIVLFWGKDLATLYNDAYRPVFGASTRTCWACPPARPGVTPGDGPAGSLRGRAPDRRGLLGERSPVRDRAIRIPEETYFDVSYDPVRTRAAAWAAFCIVTETTVGSSASAAQDALRARYPDDRGAKSAEEACRVAAEVIAADPQDLASLYLSARRR